MVLIHGLLSNLNTTHYLVGSDICCDVMFIHLGNVAIIMVRVCRHSEPKSRNSFGNYKYVLANMVTSGSQFSPPMSIGGVING